MLNKKKQMKLLKYSSFKKQPIVENSDVYIDSIKKRIQEKLRIFETKSEIQKNTIVFKRIVRNTTHSGMNKIEALKIIREGIIWIEKTDSNSIKIFWEVNLDTLLFLSTLIGLVIGLLVVFVGIKTVFSIIFGLSFFVIAYFIGCTLIKIKMDKIIEESV